MSIVQVVVKTDPAQYDAWCLLGDVSRRLGDVDQAALAYQQAITLRSDAAEIRLELGNCYFMQNRLVEAIDCYEHAF